MVSSVEVEPSPKADALTQRYIELLEKRVAQLEGVIKKADAAATGSVSEATMINFDESQASKDGKKTRYRNILRKWDKSEGSFKDTEVEADTIKKLEEKDVAYTFRRVYDPETGEKGAYSAVDIEDEHLIQLLKTHIVKYPGVNFDGDKVYMRAPFPALIHKWDKLQEVAKKTPDDQACKDLASLLNRIETSPDVETYFKLRDSHSSSKVVTFETLWTIFAPGDFIVARPYMKKPQILRVEDSPIPYSFHNRLRALWMSAWCWDWDGKEMIKVQYRLKFETFRGTKPITELPYYPLEYYAKPDELKSRVLAEALMFIRATALCQLGSSQMFRYDGTAYADKRQILAKDDSPGVDEESEEFHDQDKEEKMSSKLVPVYGEIIVDAQAFRQYASGTHSLGDINDHNLIFIDELQKSSDEAREFLARIQALRGSNRVDESNENFLLLPPRLLGYATREKIWGQFSVCDTKESLGKQPDKFEKSLQLDAKYKNLIEALVKSHQMNHEKRTSEKIVEDVVEGKGKGLVLLLHGPPGVGKTLTAETIAEATGKPLVVVSIAEIGLDVSKAERNLNKLFALATKWEAVLLVDEADVFLETRGSTSDAQRNALVSVLLRVLEYYQGIIILTTNRIKSIDVAVVSRIHLAVRYTDLSEEKMKAIFKYFLDQLEPSLINDREEMNEFVEGYGQHYGLNGRQIRNVVSAALAAARHEAESPHLIPHSKNRNRQPSDGRLTARHLKDVCEMTRKFQEQLKDNTMQQRMNNEVQKG